MPRSLLRVRPRGMAVVDAPAWVALAGVLALLALVGWVLPAQWLDWQPALAPSQWWRSWTPVAVHLSPLHLVANLAGAVAVAALGWAAAVPARVALAWLIAWPLTHVGLGLRPDLVHYGGLSGVLHAGVACVGFHLLLTWSTARRQALIGAAVLAVLIGKVLLEAPWGPAARAVPGWDIAVAPIGHATGVIAGLVSLALVAGFHRRLPVARGDPGSANE